MFVGTVSQCILISHNDNNSLHFLIRRTALLVSSLGQRRLFEAQLFV